MSSSIPLRQATARQHFRRGRFALVLQAALLVPGAASGQEVVIALEFNFSNPGARSMGFGGAFAGLADDATAAFANPAGLVQLAEPEVSVEGRLWRYSTSFVEGGRISGEPTAIGVDSSSGLRLAESSRDVSGLSFLSFVYPRGRWSLALYRHQLAKFEFFGETQGLFRGIPELGPNARERFPEQRSITDFEVVGHGFAVARRLGERFSLGVGLVHFEAELSASGGSYQPPNIADPNPFPSEALIQETYLSIDSTDWGLGAGFLWMPGDRWQLGGFFRQGAELEIAAEVRSGPRLPLPPGTLLGGGESAVSMPDVYGLGLAHRSRGGALTLAFEWSRVEYATIVQSIDADRFPLASVLDDGDELRLGAEYALLRSDPLVALRAGVWLDPDHRLRAADDQGPDSRALRPAGDDELHVAAGLGIAWETVQIDLAVDLSDLVDTASLSGIYSF